MTHAAVTLEALRADITTLAIDAIVNAANPSLLGGGGVDGAIHAAAGPELLDACRQLGGCPPGEARITPGFRLPARFVIHTVGPVFRGGNHGEAAILAACYERSLALAREHGLSSIAFPAISTGIYGYPLEEATRIAVGTVRKLRGDAEATLKRVIFCCFSERHLRCYERALGEVPDREIGPDGP